MQNAACSQKAPVRGAGSGYPGSHLPVKGAVDRQMLDTNLREGHKLSDRVHAYLRAAILEAQIKPGERIVEVDLAKKLGVSRSPVREAIRRLEQERLVEVTGLKVTVRQIPLPEIEDLFWIRCALEGMGAWLATPKLTSADFKEMETLCGSMEQALERKDFETLSRLGDEFHNVFIKASQNEKLQDMLADVKAYIARFRSVSASTPGRGGESIKQHRQILEVLRARRPEQAERLVREHIISAKLALMAGDPATR